MSEHANKREKRLAMLVVAAVVLVTVLLIVETFRLLLPGLWSAFSAGDEQALSEYLASQGRLRSFLTLWFFVGSGLDRSGAITADGCLWVGPYCVPFQTKNPGAHLHRENTDLIASPAERTPAACRGTCRRGG